VTICAPNEVARMEEMNAVSRARLSRHHVTVHVHSGGHGPDAAIRHTVATKLNQYHKKCYAKTVSSGVLIMGGSTI
jgi:ribosomal protein S9